MTDFYAHHNGRFARESEIGISPDDRGLLYGDGLFETMHALKDRVVSYAAHYERLRCAGQSAMITIPWTHHELRAIVGECVKRNHLDDAVVRVTVTRGRADQFGYGFTRAAQPTTLVMVRPSRALPASLYEKGVAVDFYPLGAFGGPVSNLKSLSALSYALAKQWALDRHAYDALLTDALDQVYEGTSSNLFIVAGGKLMTPPEASGILPGITRARILHLARTSGIAVAEKKISKRDVLDADEIFLTNTNVTVLPVTRVGTKPIGNERIGPLTRQLLDRYRQTLIEILE